jgi:hypothetical protein
MPSVKRRMSKILDEYGAAQSELIGKAAGLIDGKAGTVENVWPDECTGFGFSSEVYEGRWPVSTIKLVESWTSHWPRIAFRISGAELRTVLSATTMLADKPHDGAGTAAAMG